MSALDVQIDGQHYKNVKIQPIELAYTLGASPAFCKLAKYLSREKGDKKINLQKARHCIQLELDLLSVFMYDLSSEGAYEYNFNSAQKLLTDFSEQFTTSKNFYNALDMMYNGYRETAIRYVEDYAKELGINLDEE